MAAVAHYKTETLAQLQANFLNLEDIADGWWSGAVMAGASIDLSGLTDSSGGRLPGHR